MTTDDLIAAIGELKIDDLRTVAEAIAWQMTSAESSDFGYWITVKLPEFELPMTGDRYYRVAAGAVV